MKYKMLLGSILLCFTTYSHAGCISPVVNGTCLSGTTVYAYNSGSNNESGYESHSGTRYQYDLSNPSDNINYSTDLDAQLRDKMSTNPIRYLDLRTGQYGGSIYND